MQSSFPAWLRSVVRPRPDRRSDPEFLVHPRPPRRTDDLDVLWRRLPVSHPHRAGIGAFGHPIR